MIKTLSENEIKFVGGGIGPVVSAIIGGALVCGIVYILQNKSQPSTTNNLIGYLIAPLAIVLAIATNIATTKYDKC